VSGRAGRLQVSPLDPPRGTLQPGSVAVIAATLALACLASGQEPRSIDPPARPGSTSPALAAESPTTVSKEEEILMTWLEPDGRLRFARLSGETWSQPITVVEHVATLDPADRPSLTVFDTQAVRRTLIARTGDVVARSGDGGRTWARLPAPPLPFASFAGGDEGGYVFWLAAGGEGAARLLGTRVLAGETLLDPRVAGGSSTAAAMTWDGPVVAYRDENADGALDVALVRREDARWTPPRSVHVEGRRPARTPESGPRVAARRRQVAVAWYAEAPPRPRLLVAFSGDAGRTFAAPVEVEAKEGDRAPAGPVDVALDDNGHALVLWTTTGPTEATFELARVSPDGDRGEELVLAKGSPASLRGIPQIARAGGRVAVAWIDGGRVRAVAAPLAGIPAAGSRRPGAASGGRPRAYRGQGRVGEPVPDFELGSLDGDQVSLASLQGRVVLLNLWATWCLPCLGEMPELAALHERYGDQGLVVVGVSVDGADALDKVHAFVSERRIPFAVWLDPEMRLYHALRVLGLPATFVVDREGRIVLRRDRAITADDPELGKALSGALGDPPSNTSS